MHVILKSTQCRKFPGGLVVSIQCFHCRGLASIAHQGNETGSITMKPGENVWGMVLGVKGSLKHSSTSSHHCGRETR